MDLKELIAEKNILVNIEAQDQREVFIALSSLLKRNGVVTDSADLVRSLMDRESLGRTAVGQGVAFPHTRSAAAKKSAIAIGISKSGVSCGALDGRPTHVFFLMVEPERPAGQRLHTMSRLFAILRERNNFKAFRQASSASEVMALLR